MNGLYIHIPFCKNKCFYCSFAVSIGQRHRIDEYLECLDKEASLYKGKKITTVYIGGGTPTFMSADQLEILAGIVKTNFNLSKDAEWTVEANPEQLDMEKLMVLNKKGVNRISLGVQSFNDSYLKYLGRNHDSSLAITAFKRIREAQFDNVSVDLMCAFPNQTLEELENDLDEVVLLNSDHVSLYTLTIEEKSRFYAQKINPGDDRSQAGHYMLVCRKLAAAGFEQYEVSNFAKPGFQSRHNRNYWLGGEYIGLGMGAHSHQGVVRSWNVDKLHSYLKLIKGGQSPQEGFEELDAGQKLNEILLFGLRMNEGVDVNKIETLSGRALRDDQKQKIAEFIRNELLSEGDGQLRVTQRGRMVLDEISAQLI